jgi:putative ABC transport system permease protein
VRFGVLVLQNLYRQRMRTALTVIGIAIGITTVVALGTVTGGLKSASEDFITAGGADFMVAQEGASDLSFSTLPERDVQTIARRPGVARANGILFEVADVGSNPYFLFFGYDPAALAEERLDVVSGRLLRAGGAREVVLGARAADDLGAKVSGTVVLDGARFRVVGIYRTDDRWRNGGAIVPLATAQALASKHGVVTAVHVFVSPGAEARDVAAGIERDVPGTATIASSAEYSKVDQGLEILDAVNLAISLLAVGIGAIGVTNTMIMSVFERTREIGILRAVGWRGSRILRMIVLESLALCLVAAAIGTVLGVLATRLVLLVPAVSSFLAPSYAPEIFLRALLVGVVVALAGAAYPAVRAVRLSPMEALRHE